MQSTFPKVVRANIRPAAVPSYQPTQQPRARKTPADADTERAKTLGRPREALSTTAAHAQGESEGTLRGTAWGTTYAHGRETDTLIYAKRESLPIPSTQCTNAHKPQTQNSLCSFPHRHGHRAPAPAAAAAAEAVYCTPKQTRPHHSARLKKKPTHKTRPRKEKKKTRNNRPSLIKQRPSSRENKTKHTAHNQHSRPPAKIAHIKNTLFCHSSIAEEERCTHQRGGGGGGARSGRAALLYCCGHKTHFR